MGDRPPAGGMRSASYYKWLVLGTVGLGVLTSTVDGSIVNIALPEFGEIFDKDAGTVVWISVIFLLSSVGLMLTLGSLGDVVGRKRVFLSGFAVFGLGLVGASVSETFTQLLVARAVQGVGQALIISNGNALVVAAFPPTERGRALGLENAVVGVGLASGAPLGGLLLGALGWQALFWTRIPFMAVFFVLGLLILQPDRKGMKRMQFDLLGAVTIFVAMSTFILAINRGPKIGWTDPFVFGLLALAVFSTVSFLLAEKRAKVPVLELSLFKNRMFSFSNGASALQFLSQGAIIILMPFFLQDARSLSPFEAGMILITLPASRLVAGPIAGWASDKVAARSITTIGLLVMTLAYFGLRTVGLDTPMVWLVVLLLVEGVGTSIFGPANNSAVMGSVPASYLGTASGMIATVRQTSQTTGLALSATLFAAFQATHELRLLGEGVAADVAERQASSLGVQEVLTVMLVFLVAGTIISALRGSDSPRIPDPVGNDPDRPQGARLD
ncbi:MAG: MFS transporter [Dehalococcoidia bacterium]|nr:MFS transporter [Dehalococcoidia bacterium]